MAAGSARARNVTEADSGGGRVAPPLDLPPRPNGSGSNGSGSNGSGSNGSGWNGSAGSASGWSRGAGRSTGSGSGSGRRSAVPGRVHRLPGLLRRRSGARRARVTEGPRRPSPAAVPAGAADAAPLARPGRPADGPPRAPGRREAGQAARRGRPRPRRPPPRPPSPPAPVARRRPTATARTNRLPRRSGCVRYGGTSRAGGHRGSQSRPAEGRLRPGRRGAGRARLLAHPAQDHPLARDRPGGHLARADGARVRARVGPAVPGTPADHAGHGDAFTRPRPGP